jgi:hypothetical protein
MTTKQERYDTLVCECGYMPVWWIDLKAFRKVKDAYPSSEPNHCLLCFNCGNKVSGETQQDAIDGWEAIYSSNLICPQTTYSSAAEYQ